MEFIPLLQDAVCLATGVILRRTRMMNTTDEEAAIQFLGVVTGPAFVIQALCSQGQFTNLGFLACGYGLIYSLCSHTLAWILHRKRHPREKAVFTGCSVGSSAVLWSFPLAETVFGIAGMQAAALFNFSNIFADQFLSYLNFSSAGPAFPESYAHEDGGIYRGQWNGLKKHGVGTYKYPSGATYEGEWKDNFKTGRGVYYFPTGGLYEGEWMNGNRNGIGVRSFSNGSFQAGRWEDNKLIVPMEIWQCQDALMNATQAAKAAREVKVGGGKLLDALHEIMSQPLFWATSAALVINVLKLKLSPTINLVSHSLAALHRPFALITAGMTVSFLNIQTKEVHKAVQIVCQRVILALVLSSALLFGAFHNLPDLIPLLLPVLVISLAPISQTALMRVRLFQLNESLVRTAVSLSSLTSVFMILCISGCSIFTRSRIVYPNVVGLYVSWIASGCALLSCVVTLLLWLAFRPQAKTRMTLTNLESIKASELSNEEVKGMLQTIVTASGASIAQSSSTQAKDKKDSENGNDASPFSPVDRDEGNDSASAASAIPHIHRVRRNEKQMLVRGNHPRYRCAYKRKPVTLWQRNLLSRVKCRFF